MVSSFFNGRVVAVALTCLFVLVFVPHAANSGATKAPTSKPSIIGIDGSVPPYANSWRFAKVYATLKIQPNVTISFQWLSPQGLTVTQNVTEYNKCSGNGQILVPADTDGGSFMFLPNSTGTYYFYNNNKAGAMCKAGMKAEVIVSDSQPPCKSAPKAASCALLSQCKWQKPRRRKGHCVARGVQG